jgi:hypothetical protein
MHAATGTPRSMPRCSCGSMAAEGSRPYGDVAAECLGWSSVRLPWPPVHQLKVVAADPRGPEAPCHRAAPSSHAGRSGSRRIHLSGQRIQDRGSRMDHMPTVAGRWIGIKTELDLLTETKNDLAAEVVPCQLKGRRRPTVDQYQASEEEDVPRSHALF